MKIMFGGNKMSAKVWEINKFEYLKKLIYTEIMLKIYNNIYNARFLTSSFIKSSKGKHHQQIFRSKLKLFAKTETFITFNTFNTFNTWI